jgi:hypothetical protein
MSKVAKGAPARQMKPVTTTPTEHAWDKVTREERPALQIRSWESDLPTLSCERTVGELAKFYLGNNGHTIASSALHNLAAELIVAYQRLHDDPDHADLADALYYAAQRARFFAALSDRISDANRPEAQP